jgi:signal transduction histidine kinase
MTKQGLDTDDWLDVLTRRQRLDIMGDLEGGVAHELNNALSVIHGYEELLLEALDEPPLSGADDRDELRKRARTVHTWTGTALTVARKLHTLATLMRDEDGNCEVNKLISIAVDLCRYRCEREKMLLIADLESDPALVRCNSGELLQVLVNLIQNAREAIAREASDDGGAIHLRTEAHADGVRITIEDDGPGLPENRLQEVFEVGNSSKSGSGVGLGLPIARRVVRRGGGEVRAEAAEGGRFLIDLPAVQ